MRQQAGPEIAGFGSGAGARDRQHGDAGDAGNAGYAGNTGYAVSEDVLPDLRGPRPTETSEAVGMRHQLEIHVDRVDGVLVVAPVGEIDIVTGGLFLESLIAAISTGESQLIIDLGRVPFMDSTGLTIFLSADRAMRAVDGQLHVVANAEIAEVFELARMDEMFPVHADIAAAVAQLERA